MSANVTYVDGSEKAAANKLLKVEWIDMLSPGTNVLTLTYTLDELKVEVEKRTSYLGKFRSTEQVAHLLDLIAVTKDESDLFQSFLYTTAAEVYDAFAKYAGEKSGFECDSQVMFACALPMSINTGFTKPLDIAVKDALVYGIIYNWLLLAYPSDAETYIGMYNVSLNKVRERMNIRRSNTGMIIPRAF